VLSGIGNGYVATQAGGRLALARSNGFGGVSIVHFTADQADDKRASLEAAGVPATIRKSGSPGKFTVMLDVPQRRKLPVPSKYRDGTAQNAIELEIDQLPLLGVARIESVGNENIYVVKNGVHYYCKVMATEAYEQGEWDFAEHRNLPEVPEALREPVFSARNTMHEETPESKAIVQELLALIGRRALEGKTPFDFSRGTSTGALRGWIGNDTFHLTLEIRPEDFMVWIEISHTFATVTSHLEVPGEIVGLHREEGYSSVYFSLERGNRHSNLFSLLDALGPAILKTMDLARTKVEEKRRKLMN
jgi:hypothetical protein